MGTKYGISTDMKFFFGAIAIFLTWALNVHANEFEAARDFSGLNLLQSAALIHGETTGVNCAGIIVGRNKILSDGHCFGAAESAQPQSISLYVRGRRKISGAVTKIENDRRYDERGKLLFSYDGVWIRHSPSDFAILTVDVDLPYQQMESIGSEWVSMGDAILILKFCAPGDLRDVLHAAAFSEVERVAKVDPKFIVFETPKRETCNGDSGSPAFVVKGRSVYFYGILKDFLNFSPNRQITTISSVSATDLGIGISEASLTDTSFKKAN